jgi:hypothetical protein
LNEVELSDVGVYADIGIYATLIRCDKSVTNLIKKISSLRELHHYPPPNEILRGGNQLDHIPMFGTLGMESYFQGDLMKNGFAFR